MNYRQRAKARHKYIQRKNAEMQRQMEKTQRALHTMLQREVMDNLDIQDGMIRKTPRNYQFKARFDQIRTKFIREDYGDFFKWLAVNLNSQVDMVTDYYKSMFTDWKKGTENNVKTLASRRLGINQDGSLRDGWLHDLYQDDTYFTTLRQRISRAISTGQSYGEFREEMRTLVSGLSRSTTQGRRLGLVETHLRTFVYDVFAQHDRQLVNDYAEDLDLNYAIYSGGEMDTSREFCIERNGNLYSREEIESWANQQWPGKSTPYDPFIDCGGYNCNHTLDWISDELAEQLIARQGLNEYN